MKRDQSAEAFFTAARAEILQGGDLAYYSSGFDRIHIPEFSRFVKPFGCYSVLAHELTH